MNRLSTLTSMTATGALLLALAFVGTGCKGQGEVCPPGADGCRCPKDGACDSGDPCNEGWCVAGGCTPGTQNCTCDASDLCDDPFECQGGTCVDASCIAGEINCPCEPGNSCTGTLVCEGGVCVPDVGDCSGGPSGISGTLRTEDIDVDVSNVMVSLTHRQDSEPGLGGCVTEVELSMDCGTDCSLQLTASGIRSSAGLFVDSFNLTTSEAAGFSPQWVGTFTDISDMVVAAVGTSDATISEPAAAMSCAEVDVELQLSGTVNGSATDPQLQIMNSTIIFSGPFPSIGDTGATCPPVCGDGTCAAPETPTNCPQDCP